MRVLNERFADANVDLLDGIKVFDDRGWMQVLPDPDEPLDPHLRRGKLDGAVSEELEERDPRRSSPTSSSGRRSAPQLASNLHVL